MSPSGDSRQTITAIDPETGETDEVTFNTQVNGWTYDPDERLKATVTWKHPTNEDYYVGWEKTGGHTWSAWLSVPGKVPADTIYRSFATPEDALREAESIMRAYSPDDAENAEW